MMQIPAMDLKPVTRFQDAARVFRQTVMTEMPATELKPVFLEYACQEAPCYAMMETSVMALKPVILHWVAWLDRH
jgi:hypothetical protein